jgi:hypothetical protein
MALISINSSNLSLNPLNTSSANTSASNSEDMVSPDTNTVLQAMQTALKILTGLVNSYKDRKFTHTLITERAERKMRKGKPFSVSPVQYNFRQKYSPLIEKICKRIAKEFQLQNADVLEIGSGIFYEDPISNKIDSYLSRIFPYRKWTYSDFPQVAFQFAMQTSVNYIPFDLTDMGDKKTGSFNAILGCNVLDTIPYDKLSKAFSNISKMLKPKDVCIHIADLNLYANPFYEMIAQENAESIILPAKERHHNIYIIQKKDFNQILKEKANQLSSQELNFFDYWSRQNSILQAASLMNFDGCPQKGRSQMVERIENIFSSKLKEVNSQTKFEFYLEEAAEKNGFKIVKCGLDSEYLIEQNDSASTEQNYHLLINGYENVSKCFALAPRVTYKEAYVHIFIAQKF